MATQIAVIYGNTDRIIHRLIKPTNDAAIVAGLAKTGETLTTVILSTYNTYSTQKALATSLGLLG